MGRLWGAWTVADADVCVDEQLVVFRGWCAFKVYVRWIWDKVIGFCGCWNMAQLKFQSISGKRRLTFRNWTRSNGFAWNDVRSDWLWKNCSGENFVTRLNLSRTLLGLKITNIGAVRKNKQFILPGLKKIKGKEQCSSVLNQTDPKKQLTSPSGSIFCFAWCRYLLNPCNLWK